MTLVHQMIGSRIFERTFLFSWEKKDVADKTWDEVQDYFGEEYLSIKTFETNAGNYKQINETKEGMKEASGDEIK